ncbi:MAG: hypothetical protein ACI8TP_005407 [Acidimicrobiales bacterium]
MLSQHPNIVNVFSAAFTDDRLPCIVMEHYAGGTLGDRVKQHGPLSLDQLLAIGVQVAGALQTAHDRGVIHRDIKPQNLFVSEYGQPALGDFGISSFDDDRTITGGGGLTVHYAPPELIEGEPANAASDLYSLAATLFTLATGKRPYPRSQGQSVGELARRILIEPAPRLPHGGWPIEFSDVLWQAMAKRAGDRPVSAAAFGRQLQEIQRQQGLTETPLALANEGDHPRPVSSSVAPTLAPAGRPPTVAVEDQAIVDEPGVPFLSTRRFRAMAVGAGALVMLMIVVAAAAFGGAGTEDAQPTTTVSVPNTIDDFFSAPSAPTGVVMTSLDGGGGVEISWSPSPEAGGYQVTRIDTGDVVEVDRTFLMVDLNASERPCFEVVAIGETGKLSLPTQVLCSK